MMSQHFLALTLLASCVMLAGCGSSSTVQVSGKLTKAGAVYKPTDGYRVGVTLYALGEKQGDAGGQVAKEPYAAVVDPETSTFRVPGPDGSGIPPGKYRVSIVEKRTRDAVDTAEKTKHKAVDRDDDFFKNRYSPESSLIVRQIDHSDTLTIDLAAADGTPGGAPPSADDTKAKQKRIQAAGD